MAPSRTSKATRVSSFSTKQARDKSAGAKTAKTPKALAAAVNKKSSKTLQDALDLDAFEDTRPAKKKGETDLVWKVYKGPELAASLQKDNIWSLFESNMHDMYIKANDPHLKWDPVDKKKELFDAKSRFIVLESEDHSELVAFSMFRFEADENYEGKMEFLMYLYEIQVAPAFQGSGICRRIFTALEDMSSEYKVELIMLTVFRCNTSATTTYRHLGYKDHVDTNDNSFVLFKAIR